MTGQRNLLPENTDFRSKKNFGTLAQNGLVGNDTDGDDEAALWNGDTVAYRQEPTPQATYQTRIENGIDGGEYEPPSSQDIKFWSDFNRVYYHPRSIQALPDIPDWQDTHGDWKFGQETFVRYVEEKDLMETSIRAFLEECDYFQGLQVMNDTSTFGSFTYSLLSAFRDELSKTPSIIFPLMSDAVPHSGSLKSAGSTALRKSLNDALYLRAIYNDVPATIIPIRSPSTWQKSLLSPTPSIDRSDYHSSALLSAHIENSTIRLRTKFNRETISMFSSTLNRDGLHRFGRLHGTFLLYNSSLVEGSDPVLRAFDFSSSNSTSTSVPQEYFSRKDVKREVSLSRSLDPNTTRNTTSTNALLPPYPIPSSFPNIFGNISRRVENEKRREDNLAIASCLSVTSGVGSSFGDYARFVTKCMEQHRGSSLLQGIADDLDELKELANDLWMIHDVYIDEEVEDSGAGLGNDEE